MSEENIALNANGDINNISPRIINVERRRRNAISYSGSSPLLHTECTNIDNYMNINMHLLEGLVETYEKTTAICKIIDAEHNICMISQEIIQPDEYYYTCNICKSHMKRKELKEWLMRQGRYKSSCPGCRSRMETYPQLIINKE